jgi:ABC-type glycerol-3-phosphate transport system substrate-binding protein
MFDRTATRRGFLKATAMLTLAGPLLAACGATPGAPTAAPAAPPAAAPTAPPAAAPTAAPAAAPTPTTAPQATAAPGGAKIPVSIATRGGAQLGDWMRLFAKNWANQHPEVALTMDDVPYQDMANKQLLQIAAGNMEDVSFSGVKWFPYTVFKGGFRAIDDYIKSNDPGVADFIPSCLDQCTFEGKLYGFPYHIDDGNQGCVIFNLNILGDKGVKAPTDEWTVQDFVDLAVKVTDPGKKIWGTDYLPTNYYDYNNLPRSWGSDLFSPDGKKLQLTTDPKVMQSMQWLVDLRAKYHVGPNRDASQGLDFAAGQLAMSGGSFSLYQVVTDSVGDKFKWDIVLFPKGPAGVRGYHTFVEMFSIFSKTKQPEKAFDLMSYLTSKEAGLYMALKGELDPGGRKSAWSDPQVQALKTGSFATGAFLTRCLDWITTGNGHFPEPYNLRYSEFQDKWGNTVQPLLYGEVPFDQGMKTLQAACQAIVDEPRQ